MDNDKPLVPENINLNTENVQECIKTMTHWGETAYHNVCEGTSTMVSWGAMDYLLAIGLIAFFGVTILAFFVMVYKMAFDY